MTRSRRKRRKRHFTIKALSGAHKNKSGEQEPKRAENMFDPHRDQNIEDFYFLNM